MYLHALAADVLSTLLRQMCSVRSCQTCAQYALAADVDAWEDFLSEIALDRKPLINYNEFGVRTTRKNQ